MAETETILISIRNAAPIMGCAVREGDFPSREELAAIQRGIDDVRNGNTFRMAKNESLDDFLNRIEGCVRSGKAIFLQEKSWRPFRGVLMMSGTEIPSEWLKTSLWTIF